MKRLLQLALVVLPIVGIGCRQNPYVDTYIEMMNAEKRMLEDQINDLQHDYKAKVAELENCRTEVKRLESELDEPGGFRMDIPDLPGAGGDANPSFDLSPPNINPGDPADPSNVDDEAPPSPPEEVRAESRLDSNQITHLFLNPVETRMTDAEANGPGGLLVSLEPRNSADRFVPEPGTVSIAVVNAANNSRIARWDFDPHEVEAAMNRPRRLVQLEMQWPSGPPNQQSLELHVRFTTEDGRDVRANMPLSATLSQLSAGWTPRTPRRRLSDADPVNVARQNDTPRTLSRPVAVPPRRVPVQDSANRPQWRPYR